MLMTNEEIRTSYRDAANKPKQIGVLADLNGCDTDLIRKILGLGEPPIATVVMMPPTPKPKAPTVTPKARLDAKTAMIMYREGRNDREIADHFGVIPDAVAKWRKRNGLPPVGREVPKPPVPAVAAKAPVKEVKPVVPVPKPVEPAPTAMPTLHPAAPPAQNPLASIMPAIMYKGYLIGRIVDTITHHPMRTDLLDVQGWVQELIDLQV